MDILEKQKHHFNHIAETYYRARSNPNHIKLKELIWDYALKDIDIPNSSDVLEAMCGFADGHEIISRRLKNFNYSGFDYSDNVVAHLNKHRKELNVWCQDATKFTQQKNYDLIVLLGGLHHVPTFSKDVVRRLCEALKPGGYFINFEPTHGNILFKKVREKIYNKNKLFDEESEKAFSIEELKQHFTSQKLSEIKIIYPGLLSYILFYNPDAFPALNIGSPKLVSVIWAMEKILLKTRFAGFFSFATLSIWQKK